MKTAFLHLKLNPTFCLLSISLINFFYFNFYVLLEGKKHDAGMLRESGLLEMLEEHAFGVDGRPMCIYGDPAYPLRVHLQAPFRLVEPNPDMEAFNKCMSAVRVSVEWLFGDIVSSFKFIDYKKDLKIALSAVGKMYVVSGILRNCLTCLYGNSTSEYFELPPPTIQEYLG